MRGHKIDKTFGKRVRKIRKEMKFTQEKLAERVGISLTHMGRIERGVSTPPLTLIEKIARGLGKNIRDLF